MRGCVDVGGKGTDAKLLLGTEAPVADEAPLAPYFLLCTDSA